MASTLHPPDVIGCYRISDFDPITGDASGRQYWRVAVAGEKNAVLCRYPDRMRGLIQRDLEVLVWLSQQGLPVPRIKVGTTWSSWVLLEDLGHMDGEYDLRETVPASRPARAVAFLEPLIRLAALGPQRLPQWNPPFDFALLRWELNGFEMWSVPDTKRPTGDSVLSKWLDDLATTVASHPRKICLRDYHLNNIILDGVGGVGIIDVQDIRLGPDTYDLASLLADRAMPELLTAKEREAIAQAWAEAVDAAPGWARRLQETTLQRALKVLGTFAFLKSQGLHGYQQWVPKTASIAAENAQNLGSPSETVAILLDLASTGGVDVW